jgi:hypothetical protein
MTESEIKWVLLLLVMELPLSASEIRGHIWTYLLVSVSFFKDCVQSSYYLLIVLQTAGKTVHLNRTESTVIDQPFMNNVLCHPARYMLQQVIKWCHNAPLCREKWYCWHRSLETDWSTVYTNIEHHFGWIWT